MVSGVRTCLYSERSPGHEAGARFRISLSLGCRVSPGHRIGHRPSDSTWPGADVQSPCPALARPRDVSHCIGRDALSLSAEPRPRKRCPCPCLGRSVEHCQPLGPDDSQRLPGEFCPGLTGRAPCRTPCTTCRRSRPIDLGSWNRRLGLWSTHQASRSWHALATLSKRCRRRCPAINLQSRYARIPCSGATRRRCRARHLGDGAVSSPAFAREAPVAQRRARCTHGHHGALDVGRQPLAARPQRRCDATLG